MSGAVSGAGFRIAMRVEGENWTAYYAPIDTIDGAVWLGSVSLKIVSDPERKKAFMGIMQSFIADAVKEFGGKIAGWDEPQPAPEHERAGRA